jgi:hypothetical protein
LFASLRDRNHALHQHPREYLFLPRHACLPVAEPALPVTGRLHLCRLRGFACVHTGVALRRSRRRRRPSGIWRTGPTGPGGFRWPSELAAEFRRRVSVASLHLRALPDSAPATVHVRLHTAAAMCSSEDCRLTMCDLLYQLHASSGLPGERFRHLQCHFVWGPWSDAAAVPAKFRSTDTVRRRRPGTGAAWDASRAAASVSFAGELFGGVLHKGPGHMQPDGGHALHPVGDINL